VGKQKKKKKKTEKNQIKSKQNKTQTIRRCNKQITYLLLQTRKAQKSPKFPHASHLLAL
jgi:hypothetical protein